MQIWIWQWSTGNGLTKFLYDQFMKWFFRVRFSCPDCDSLEFEMLAKNCQNQSESYVVYKAMDNTQTS